MLAEIDVRVKSFVLLLLAAGKPVMIVTEYMENGSLDSFLRVSPD